MDHSRPLSELGRADEPRFGGKSARLGDLLSAEIPVPAGFALSIDAFGAFVDGAGLTTTIADAVRGLQGGDVEAIAAAAFAIDEAMRSAPVPEPVRRAVQARYRALGDDVPVAVRSSAVGEDSHEATFAGQQESYLWVRGFEPLCEAVRDCWISLFSPPAISYRLGIGSPTNPAAMGVAVQLMVDAAVSGVMFTCNPVSGDRSMVAINASWGLGPAVVGGEVTPDDFLLSKVTGEVVREHVHPKPIEYVADPARGRERPGWPCPSRDVARAAWTTRRSRAWSSSPDGSSATSARTRTSSGRSTTTATRSSCSRAPSRASGRVTRSRCRRMRSRW